MVKWPGHQQAGHGKIIERLVVVESIDHPVAIRRNVLSLIAVISNGVRISDEIQPVAQPFFHHIAEQSSNRSTSLSYALSDGSDRNCSAISISRRQSGEIKTNTPQQSYSISIRAKVRVVRVPAGLRMKLSIQFRGQSVICRTSGFACLTGVSYAQCCDHFAPSTTHRRSVCFSLCIRVAY